MEERRIDKSTSNRIGSPIVPYHKMAMCRLSGNASIQTLPKRSKSFRKDAKLFDRSHHLGRPFFSSRHLTQLRQTAVRSPSKDGESTMCEHDV